MLEAKLFKSNDVDPGGSGAQIDDGAGPWPAPHVAGPIDARIVLPGSKSLTNRELVLAALADGPGLVRAALMSRDTILMIDALRALGAEIEQLPHDDGTIDLRVTPASELTGSTTIACGLAGTVMRFVPPIAALALGPTGFDGDPYARKRPMRPVLDALSALGADIADDGRGTLPFTVHGTAGLKGGRVEIDASLSSQFVSALLLSAPRFDEGVHIVHTGESLPSLPHIEMTLAALRARGVTADSPAPGEWRVEPGPIRARDVTIEPDLSNAAPFLAAALVAGGRVSIPNWPQETTQVGDRLRDLLPEFGAEVRLEDGTLVVTGDGRVRGVELHIPDAGELAPTLVALAAIAAHGSRGQNGESSRITGIGHIRHHETNRIAALVSEIGGLSGEAEELEDGIVVRPAPLTVHGTHEGLWHSFDDHRMATSGALIGLRIAGVSVDDIACTSKTLPDFEGLWDRLLGASQSSAPASADHQGDLPSTGTISASGILSGLIEGF